MAGSKEAYLNCPRCWQLQRRGERYYCGWDGAWLAVYPPEEDKGAYCPGDDKERCRQLALEASGCDKVENPDSVWHR